MSVQGAKTLREVYVSGKVPWRKDKLSLFPSKDQVCLLSSIVKIMFPLEQRIGRFIAYYKLFECPKLGFFPSSI